MADLLKGKKALITGGTSGLGRAIALCFIEEGADVAILGRSNQRAEEVLKQMQKIQPYQTQKTWAYCADVSQKEEVQSASEALIKEWGDLDILVNSAGVTRDKLLLRMEESDWDYVMDTNLKSVYHLCRAFIKLMMKKRCGKIINISSVIGLTGNPGQVNYAASKLGMVGLTRSLAKELASRGICVNCIAPGFFETPMTDKLSEEQKAAVLKRVPMGRLGSPEELANVALFFANDSSAYITGQVLAVDGGMLA